MDPPASYELFRHKPLNLNESSFRLLDILGVSSDGLIECTVNQYKRDELHQSYRALSYMWGPETPAGWILLNGKAFRVRENLLSFLRSTTSHREARKAIWIDAICIDQDSISERNHQVRQMADIYRNAATVYAWLGPSAGNLRELLELLKNVEAIPQTEGNIAGEISKPSISLRYQIYGLLWRPYWGRTWIVQEITLAQGDVLLLWGEHTFSWSTVKRLCIMMESFPNIWQIDDWQPARQVARAADLLQTKSRPLTILHLLRELNGGTTGSCADARDKVYALLGMASDTGPLEPDYTIPLAKLFFEVLKSEYALVETNTVTIDDAVLLRRAIGVDPKDLIVNLDVEESHGYAEELVECKAGSVEIKKLYQHWYRPGRDVEVQFNYDRSLASSTALIHPLDIACSFTGSGTRKNLRNTMIFRQTSNGRYACVAIAEFGRLILEFRIPRVESLERCFLYSLPELHKIQPFEFHIDDDVIRLPVKIVLYLAKLEEMYPLVSDHPESLDESHSSWIRDDPGYSADQFYISYRKRFRVGEIEKPEDPVTSEPIDVEALEEYSISEHYEEYRSSQFHSTFLK